MRLTEEDEAIVKSMFGEGNVKRIYEEDEESRGEEISEQYGKTILVNPKIESGEVMNS